MQQGLELELAHPLFATDWTRRTCVKRSGECDNVGGGQGDADLFGGRGGGATGPRGSLASARMGKVVSGCARRSRGGPKDRDDRSWSDSWPRDASRRIFWNATRAICRRVAPTERHGAGGLRCDPWLCRQRAADHQRPGWHRPLHDRRERNAVRAPDGASRRRWAAPTLTDGSTLVGYTTRRTSLSLWIHDVILVVRRQLRLEADAPALDRGTMVRHGRGLIGNLVSTRSAGVSWC